MGLDVSPSDIPGELVGQGAPPPRPPSRPSAARYEYRIAWRRADWSERTADKSRTFQSRQAALAFVARLQGRDRPDLAPIVRSQLSRRRVEPWMEGWA